MAIDNQLPDHMPQLPPRITVQVVGSDFGPTNLRSFGVSFNLLIGKDKGMSFRAGGGNRRTVRGSFQASLPDTFNLLEAKEQMKLLYDQLANASTEYFCRDTNEIKFLSPDNFERRAWYGNTIEG